MVLFTPNNFLIVRWFSVVHDHRSGIFSWLLDTLRVKNKLFALIREKNCLILLVLNWIRIANVHKNIRVSEPCAPLIFSADKMSGLPYVTV